MKFWKQVTLALAMFHTADGGIIDEIGQLISGNADLRKLIIASLKNAFSKGELGYNHSDIILSWPDTTDKYQLYLNEYQLFIPDESASYIKNAAKDPEEHREAVTRRMHFFYLISHPNTTGARPMDNADFKSLIYQYTSSHYDYLDDGQSFNNVQLAYYKAKPSYDVVASLVRGKPNEPSGWNTFNQFIARDLNPGQRPITDPFDNSVATAPVDMTYVEMRNISADSSFVQGPMDIMGTHSYSDVLSVFGAGSPHLNSFANGTVIRVAVPPAYCHRIHSPVDGTVVETRDIISEEYLDVTIKNGSLTVVEPAAGSDGFRFRQHRGVLTVDTSTSSYGDVGLVAVVPIGMGHPESVRINAVNGTAVRKGDDLGFMAIGSSAVLLFFQEKAGLSWHYDTKFVKKLRGTSIATLTSS